MIRWWFVLVALSGCDVIFRIDGIVEDARAHPPDQAADCVGGYGPDGRSLLVQCGVGDSPVALPSVINTDAPDCTMMITASQGPTRACVLTGSTITMPNDVTVIGTLPLVIAARQTIVIDHVFISESLAAENPAACMSKSPPPASSLGAGGAGGSWQTPGSAGGAANTPGGTPDVTHPIALRFGCEGVPGAAAPDAPQGPGGSGGGALYFTARGSITITDHGLVGAAGRGGGPGLAATATASGGGGGGSGGLIVFDTPSLTVVANAQIFANGGGGGGGGVIGATPSGAGGVSFQALGAAPGGLSSSSRGGDGGIVGRAPTTPASSMGGVGGGGGGGGGLGWIVLYSASSPAPGSDLISPALTLNP